MSSVDFPQWLDQLRELPTSGHGGPDTVLKGSLDGGLTWSERLPVPENFTGKHNAPSVHRVVDPSGVERLVLFVSSPAMKQSVSEDDGETWTPLETLFGDEMQGTSGYKRHAPPSRSSRSTAGPAISPSIMTTSAWASMLWRSCRPQAQTEAVRGPGQG